MFVISWSLIASLLLGFAIGKSNRIPKGFFRYTEYLIIVGVIILLFSMGIEIGLNKTVMKELPILGWQAFLIALLAILFSVIVLHLFVRKLIASSIRERKIYDDMDANS